MQPKAVHKYLPENPSPLYISTLADSEMMWISTVHLSPDQFPSLTQQETEMICHSRADERVHDVAQSILDRKIPGPPFFWSSTNSLWVVEKKIRRVAEPKKNEAVEDLYVHVPREKLLDFLIVLLREGHVYHSLLLSDTLNAFIDLCKELKNPSKGEHPLLTLYPLERPGGDFVCLIRLLARFINTAPLDAPLFPSCVSLYRMAIDIAFILVDAQPVPLCPGDLFLETQFLEIVSRLLSVLRRRGELDEPGVVPLRREESFFPPVSFLGRVLAYHKDLQYPQGRYVQIPEKRCLSLLKPEIFESAMETILYLLADPSRLSEAVLCFPLLYVYCETPYFAQKAENQVAYYHFCGRVIDQLLGYEEKKNVVSFYCLIGHVIRTVSSIAPVLGADKGPIRNFMGEYHRKLRVLYDRNSQVKERLPKESVESIETSLLILDGLSYTSSQEMG